MKNRERERKKARERRGICNRVDVSRDFPCHKKNVMMNREIKYRIGIYHRCAEQNVNNFAILPFLFFQRDIRT